MTGTTVVMLKLKLCGLIVKTITIERAGNILIGSVCTYTTVHKECEHEHSSLASLSMCMCVYVHMLVKFELGSEFSMCFFFFIFLSFIR